MKHLRRYGRSCAVLLLVPAAWLAAGCSSSTSNDPPPDNHNSGSPPRTTLQLSISPQDGYALTNEELELTIRCNDTNLLPAEYLCVTFIEDPTGKAYDTYTSVRNDLIAGDSTYLDDFEVDIDDAADYTIFSRLYDTGTPEGQFALDFGDPHELGPGVVAATATLKVREPKLDITYATDSNGSTYTFIVEWQDAGFYQWHTRNVAPSSMIYFWNFDGAEQPITQKGNQLEHTFATGGTHTVKVGYPFRVLDWMRGSTTIVVGADATLTLVRPEGDLTVNTEYVFEAGYSAPLPASPYYEWRFGSGGEVVGIPGTHEATHAFSSAGSHAVSVSLFDGEGGALLGTASADVYVHPDRTARLLQAIKATGFRASINSQKNFVNRDGSPQEFPYGGCGWNGGSWTLYCKVTSEQMQWNDLSFSVHLNDTLSDSPIAGVTRRRTVDITGSISEDAAKLVTLSVNETINDTYTADGSVRLSYEQTFDINDVELSSPMGLSTFLFSTEDAPALPSHYSVEGGIYGPQAQSHLENPALDCLFYAATTWDYSYVDSAWPSGSNFTVSFEN